ncbi:hypothetical protein SAMN02745866_04324 [Alteromonadaceae bacterium Bs31]|nr:hypothetical protein SAMN02745866_04324 [Alteromonadaceae bacterium Bs31]
MSWIYELIINSVNNAVASASVPMLVATFLVGLSIFSFGFYLTLISFIKNILAWSLQAKVIGGVRCRNTEGKLEYSSVGSLFVVFEYEHPGGGLGYGKMLVGESSINRYKTGDYKRIKLYRYKGFEHIYNRDDPSGNIWLVAIMAVGLILMFFSLSLAVSLGAVISAIIALLLAVNKKAKTKVNKTAHYELYGAAVDLSFVKPIECLV